MLRGSVMTLPRSRVVLCWSGRHRVLQEPKRVNGRFLTAPELRNYASAYVELFHNGAHFPAARSLLEATAGAHNGNAKHVAVLRYKVREEASCARHADGEWGRGSTWHRLLA